MRRIPDEYTILEGSANSELNRRIKGAEIWSQKSLRKITYSIPNVKINFLIEFY